MTRSAPLRVKSLFHGQMASRREAVMTTTRHGLAEERVSPDEAKVTAEFIAFLEDVSARRHPVGIMRRFNQGRHTGCVEAEFTVKDGLPAEHRVGLFATPRTYRAFIRFANANSSSDLEEDVRGMAIMVRDVSGENLTPGVSTQDFVLNSHPVMVAPDAKEFMEFLRAMDAGRGPLALYLLRHPRSAVIAAKSREHPTCHFDIPYFSATPYLFGPGRAVKYVVKPCSDRRSPKPDRLTHTYLRDAMRIHLAHAEACFDFMIQFQTEKLPIEDATVEWEEEESPYHAVARIRIPRQGIDDADRMKQCEEVAFDPWHCLADHRPLGSMNRARRAIYPALSAFRRNRP
jgi:hypothetical protein